MTNHVVYSPEVSFANWVTPATWLSVDVASIKSARETVELATTGMGRALYATVQGAKPVAGSVSLPWWYTRLSPIWRTIMRDWASVNVSGAVYDNAFLFDDTRDLGSLSLQQQYGGSVAINVLGATAKAFKITAASKAQVIANFDFEAKDEAPASGVWDWNGVAAPALIATPSYPTLLRPLMFYDCAVKLGGTASLVGKKIVIAGGTTTKLIGTFDVGVDLGVSTDDYALAYPDPTRQILSPGNRRLSITLDVLWGSRDMTFYNAMRAGTAMALELNALGPLLSGIYRSELHICIPNFIADQSPLPDLSGDETPKRQSVTGRASVNFDVNKDFGLWIRSLEHLT